MKHYDTAKEILEASLNDIEEGRWVCSRLATSTIDGEVYDGCYIPKDDPMGCALGLVATHGGHGRYDTLEVNGVEWESFIPAYPSEPAWDFGGDDEDSIGPDASLAVIEARDALARATGFMDEAEGPNDGAVYGYNDGLQGLASNGPLRAAEWFRRALASLDAPIAA